LNNKKSGAVNSNTYKYFWMEFDKKSFSLEAKLPNFCPEMKRKILIVKTLF